MSSSRPPVQSTSQLNKLTATRRQRGLSVPAPLAVLVAATLVVFQMLPFCRSAAILVPVVSSPAMKRIIFYEDTNFTGIKWRLEVGPSTCVNLVGKLNDFFSSVDPDSSTVPRPSIPSSSVPPTCFLLYEHRNCRGVSARVTEKVKDLSSLQLNDRVSSVRLCGDTTRRPSSTSPPTPPPSSWFFLRRGERWRSSKENVEERTSNSSRIVSRIEETQRIRRRRDIPSWR